MTARELWARSKGPVIIGALILLAGLVLALSTAGNRSGQLDPRAADRTGSRALAQVLRDQGVRVDFVQTTNALEELTRDADTVLVGRPERLVAAQAEALVDTGADLVLVEPSGEVLGIVAPGVEVVDVVDTQERQPACDLPAARRAGTAELGGLVYAARTPEGGSAILCYALEGDAPLVSLEQDGRTVTLVGAASPFSNDRLDDAGNAALVLGLLGTREHLVWYLPSLGDVPEGAQRSLVDLAPDWVFVALGQVAVGVVLLALWRARRLGPVVTEPLPVLVRATETVEGRARLYRRSGARDRAAQALRDAAGERLRGPLRLRRAAAPAEVLSAIEGRTGRAAATVGPLLYGAPPVDDAALVGLADALDELERQVIPR